MALFQYLCFLEFQLFGLLHHFSREVFQHVAGIAFQYFAGLADVFLIVVIALPVDAGPQTVSDVIF